MEYHIEVLDKTEEPRKWRTIGRGQLNRFACPKHACWNAYAAYDAATGPAKPYRVVDDRGIVLGGLEVEQLAQQYQAGYGTA